MNSKEVVLAVFSTVFKVVLEVIIVMLVYQLSLTAYQYCQRVFNEPPMSEGSGRKVTVVINQEDTIKEVAEMLEGKGLIRDAEIFRIQEMLSEYKDKIIPGTYELSTSMTNNEMLEVMSVQVEEE